MRFIFASESSTPSAMGRAPPESPVPAPRATTGTPSSPQVAQHVPHLLLVLGQRHHAGQLAVCREPVALVGPRILRVEQHACLGQGPPQAADDFRALQERRAGERMFIVS